MTQNNSHYITGIVIEVKGEPSPHSFWIQGEDQHIYFSRLGDIKKNEEFMLSKKHRTEYLEKNDKVAFIPYQKSFPDLSENKISLRAINVEKLK